MYHEERHCCQMLLQRESDLKLVHMETQKFNCLEVDFHKKYEIFKYVATDVHSTLNDLWFSACTIDDNDSRKNVCFDFVSRMSASWHKSELKIQQSVKGINLVSHTNPNRSLRDILEQVLSAATLDDAQCHNSMVWHSSCLTQTKQNYSELIPKITRLLEGDLILRYYIYFCKAVPTLQNKKYQISNFFNQVICGKPRHFPYDYSQLLPPTQVTPQPMYAFTHLLQLLSGALLPMTQVTALDMSINSSTPLHLRRTRVQKPREVSTGDASSLTPVRDEEKQQRDSHLTEVINEVALGNCGKGVGQNQLMEIKAEPMEKLSAYEICQSPSEDIPVEDKDSPPETADVPESTSDEDVATYNIRKVNGSAFSAVIGRNLPNAPQRPWDVRTINSIMSCMNRWPTTSKENVKGLARMFGIFTGDENNLSGSSAQEIVQLSDEDGNEMNRFGADKGGDCFKQGGEVGQENKEKVRENQITEEENDQDVMIIEQEDKPREIIDLSDEKENFGYRIFPNRKLFPSVVGKQYKDDQGKIQVFPLGESGRNQGSSFPYFLDIDGPIKTRYKPVAKANSKRKLIELDDEGREIQEENVPVNNSIRKKESFVPYTE